MWLYISKNIYLKKHFVAGKNIHTFNLKLYVIHTTGWFFCKILNFSQAIFSSFSETKTGARKIGINEIAHKNKWKKTREFLAQIWALFHMNFWPKSSAKIQIFWKIFHLLFWAKLCNEQHLWAIFITKYNPKINYEKLLKT